MWLSQKLLPTMQKTAKGCVFICSCILAAGAAFLFCAAPASAMPALEELELSSGSGPEVLEALAASVRDSYQEQLERQRAGGKYYLNAAAGYSDEPQYDTSDNDLSYTKLSVGAGLSFPLFGTWDKLKINRLNAAIRATDSARRTQMLKVSNLAALRKAYAVLWIEAQKIKLADAFAANRDYVAAYLGARQKKALLLPADNYEFLAAYDMAKKDRAVSNLHMVQALQVIRMDTGRKLELPAEVQTPSLPVFKDARPDIESNPALAMKRDNLQKYEALADVSRRIDREGAFSVGLSGTKDIPGNFGSGVYASITLSEPLKEAVSREDKGRLAARADLERARQEVEFTRLQVEGDAEEALAMASYAAANIKAQYSRLRAIAESVRENSMRHGAIAGDTFEKLQNSRYQYYRVAMDMLDSQLILLQSGADILNAAYPQGAAGEPKEREYVVDEKLVASVVSPKWFSSAGTRVNEAVPGVDFNYQPPRYSYVWKAAPLLDQHRRDGVIAAMRGRGLQDILISFTGNEINYIKTTEGAQKLSELLQLVQGAGLKAEVSLAEPTWLLPENRQEMIAIIHLMNKFKFYGVHLDIEPDQLKGAASMRPRLTDLLVATVREAAASTMQPVSFSVHPRYLEGEFGKTLDAGLKGIRISCIIPMIYTTNAANAASRMAALLGAHPAYNFALGQSVEKSLPSSESYFTKGMKGLKDSMTEVESRLARFQNFKGVAVQSWEDYEVLK